jgi:hypothetical protein
LLDHVAWLIAFRSGCLNHSAGKQTNVALRKFSTALLNFEAVFPTRRSASPVLSQSVFEATGLSLASTGQCCRKHHFEILSMEVTMLKILTASAISVLAFAPCALQAQGSVPNVTGTWYCLPEPNTCQSGGQTFTVTQSGNDIDLKNDKGDVGRAQLTSAISLSASAPWNMLGVILSDGAIQWSNGTKWQKQ